MTVVIIWKILKYKKIEHVWTVVRDLSPVFTVKTLITIQSDNQPPSFLPLIETFYKTYKTHIKTWQKQFLRTGNKARSISNANTNTILPLVKFSKTIIYNLVSNRYNPVQATSPLIKPLIMTKRLNPRQRECQTARGDKLRDKGESQSQTGSKSVKIKGRQRAGERRKSGEWREETEEGGGGRDSEVDSSVIIIVCPL